MSPLQDYQQFMHFAPNVLKKMVKICSIDFILLYWSREQGEKGTMTTTKKKKVEFQSLLEMKKPKSSCTVFTQKTFEIANSQWIDSNSVYYHF